jgi:hypothetical protein
MDWAGVRFTGGTGFPVDPLAPVNRVFPDVNLVLKGAECLSRETSLRMHTVGSFPAAPGTSHRHARRWTSRPISCIPTTVCRDIRGTEPARHGGRPDHALW